MKFKNPETGVVFDNISTMVDTFCQLQESCGDWCPLRVYKPVPGCRNFTNMHPKEAASLMGYEVVEDNMPEPAKHKKEANMDKPRICEVLGVEVNERVSYKDPNGETVQFFINEDGTTVWVFESGKPLSQYGIGYAIAQAINHPDRIIRKPRWTEQEVERAKAIKVLYPEICYIKNDDGWLRGITKGKESIFLDRVLSWFPSVQPGQSYTLDEIIGGEDHA